MTTSLRRLADGPPSYVAPADLATRHQGLALHFARRFQGRGEDRDDLQQVALLALVKAAHRFDPAHGVEFAAFASVTIIGELKRHFRDHRWGLRVPRRLQELYLATRAATEDLQSELGRSPTVAEVGSRLGVTDEDVLEALEVGAQFRLRSLDAPADGDPDLLAGDIIGGDDGGFAHVETREQVTGLLRRLSPAERELLHLYYDERLSQAEVGARLGISQVQVSRLLARTLARLRALAERGG